MELSSQDFHYLADIIKKYSGIALEEDKGYLLQGRLLPVANKYGLSSLKEFVDYVKQNNNESLLIEIIEAMTTNESFFFRDAKIFTFMSQNVIKDIKEKLPDKNKIKIWSAACSTGQEPYTIAMEMLEKCPELDFEIFATDLDYSVIEKAKGGVYSQFEVQRGVPINLLLKYFSQEADQWRVKPNIAEKISYEKFNLMDSPSKFGKFDLIFCRNVLIYFEVETKIKVVKNLASCMEPHSALFLGATEGASGQNASLTRYPKTDIDNISGIFSL